MSANTFNIDESLILSIDSPTDRWMNGLADIRKEGRTDRPIKCNVFLTSIQSYHHDNPGIHESPGRLQH